METFCVCTDASFRSWGAAAETSTSCTSWSDGWVILYSYYAIFRSCFLCNFAAPFPEKSTGDRTSMRGTATSSRCALWLLAASLLAWKREESSRVRFPIPPQRSAREEAGEVRLS